MHVSNTRSSQAETIGRNHTLETRPPTFQFHSHGPQPLLAPFG